MDDLELEARLRTRLHNRFDDARVPRELAASVAQAMATAPASVGAFNLRLRGRVLGWSAVAAAAVLVVVAITLGSFDLPFLPGSRSTPSPAATAQPNRDFIVLPPAGAPAKPDSILASDVLLARLRALGIGNFSSGGGYAITFNVPADGPSDDTIRAVLGATGNVAFVPLPPEFYGEGMLEPLVGEPLPHAEPALFGWEGIASVAPDDTQQLPAVTITLKPAAAGAFADYTTQHLQESFAVVIDGRVASAPVINEPITGGQVTISDGGRNDDVFERMIAIFVGGMLPEAWRGAEVPEIISREVAIEAARGSLGDGVDQTVVSADLDALQDRSRWRAVWRVDFEGGAEVTVDAITGEWLSTGIAMARTGLVVTG
jgi:hypothetical protein